MTMASAGDTGRTLADVLVLIWRRRWLLLAVTAIAALTAYLQALMEAPVYRASGTVVVVESKVADNAPGRLGGDYRAQHEVVRQLLTDVSSMAAVVAATPELKGTSPESIAGRVSTTSQAFSPVMQVNLVAGTPELARLTLDRVLQHVVALNARMAGDEVEGSRTQLGPAVEASAEALATARGALATFSGTARIDERKEGLVNTLALRGVLAEQLSKARAEVGRASGARAALAAELRGRDQTVTLSRSIVDDPAMQAQAPQTGAASGVVVRSEELHPAVIKASKLLEKAIGEEAGARAEAQALEAEIKRLDRELPGMQAELTTRQLEQERLKQVYDLATDTYKDAAKRLDATRVQVVMRMPELRVLNAAVASASPVSPRPARNAFAAGIAALLLGICAAILVDALVTQRALAGERA